MVDASDGGTPEPLGLPDDGGQPEPVRRVAMLLAGAGVEARLHEFRESTPTADAAARVIGCVAEQIVKSLIFVCDGQPTLVMVSGSARADDSKIAKAVGATKVRIAKPDVVLDRTGFAVGGVAPFPLPLIKQAVCDQELLRHDVVWAGAGSDRHMVAIAPHDLLRLARARAADVAASATTT